MLGDKDTKDQMKDAINLLAKRRKLYSFRVFLSSRTKTAIAIIEPSDKYFAL